MPHRKPKKAAAPLTTAQSLASTIKSARDIMRKDKGLSGDVDRLPLLTWVLFLKFLDDLEAQRETEAQLAGSKFRPAIEAPYRWRDWAADPKGITGNDLIAFINQDEYKRADGKRAPGLFAYLKSLSSANGDDRRDVIATVFKGVQNRMVSGYLLRDVINKLATIHFTSSEELHTLGALYESMLREMRDAAGDAGEFYTPRPVVRFMVAVTDPRLGERILDPACGTGGFLVEAYEHLSNQVRTVDGRKVLQERSLFGCEPKPLPYLLCQMNLLLHGLDAPQIDSGNALRFKLTEIGEKDRVDVVLSNPPFGGEEEKGIQSNFPDDRQTSETALLFLQLIMRKLRRATRAGFPPARAAVIVPNTTLFYPGVAAKLRRELVSRFNVRAVVRMPKGVFEPYTDIETNILFFECGQPTTSRILFYRLEPPDGRKQYSKTQPLRFAELAECATLLRGEGEIPAGGWEVSAQDVLADSKCNLDLHNPRIVQSTGEMPEQVVEKIASVAGQTAAAIGRAQYVVENLRRLLESKAAWVQVRLAELLTRSKDDLEIEDGVLYRRLRIQVKGRGVVLRDEVDGSKIGTKRQFVVRAGQFILSKIDARNGAFGIVPDEGDGAVITGNFWAFDVDRTKVEPRLLHFLTRSDAFIGFCLASSPGATNRRYLQEDVFLEQVVSMPSQIEQQRVICDCLAQLEAISSSCERDFGLLRKRVPVLLQSALHGVFGGTARAVDDDLIGESELAAAEET